MLITLLLFIGLTLYLLRYMLSNDRGAHEPVTVLWGAFGFGVLAIIPAALCEYYLVPRGVVDATTGAVVPSMPTLFYGALMIGVIEELWKYLPLALFIYHKSYFNEHTDGILYFALAGVGFGLPENILYTLQFGTEIGILRLLLTPFMHASMTAIAGYCLIRVKIDQKSKMLAVAGVLLSIGIHTIYNYGLVSRAIIPVLISLSISVSLTVLIFRLTKKARQQDQAAGLSVIGINNYCRLCGTPNPKHYLYCSQCGGHA